MIDWMELDEQWPDEQMAVPVNVATLQITPDLLALVAELDEFKGWRDCI